MMMIIQNDKVLRAEKCFGMVPGIQTVLLAELILLILFLLFNANRLVITLSMLSVYTFIHINFSTWTISLKHNLPQL